MAEHEKKRMFFFTKNWSPLPSSGSSPPTAAAWFCREGDKEFTRVVEPPKPPADTTAPPPKKPSRSKKKK